MTDEYTEAFVAELMNEVDHKVDEDQQKMK